MRKFLFGCLLIGLSSPAALAGSVCLQNDTTLAVQLVSSVKKAYGGDHTTRADAIVPGASICSEVSDAVTHLQVSFQTQAGASPTYVVRDCVLPSGSGRSHYRAKGTSPDSLSCDKE